MSLKKLLPAAEPKWSDIPSWDKNTIARATPKPDRWGMNDQAVALAERTEWLKNQGGISPEHFGAVGDLKTDDTTAFHKALEACTLTGRPLMLIGAGYVVNVPIQYHQRRHSIIAFSHSVVDLRGCVDGSWCINVASPKDDGSHIWDTLTNEVIGVEFLGRPGLNGWKNDGPTTDTGIGSPRSLFSACYFVDFTNTLYFGNSEWCAVFDRCSFRGGGGAFITTSRTYNAGENIQFAKCIFNGANKQVLWNHVHGPFELTFDGCSLDYCRGVLRYDPSYVEGRLVARFRACHFEDDGSATEFEFSLPNGQAFHLELSGCDWYFTGTIPKNLVNITAAHRFSHLIFRDNAVPIFSSTQDRREAELIKWANTTGRLVAEGNSLQTESNTYHNILSRKASKFPLFDAANFKPTYGPFAFFETGTQIERLTAGQPTGAQGDIYKCSGGSSFSPRMLNEEGKFWNVAGWFYRTSGAYQLQMRYYRWDGTLIANPTVLSIPGTLNAWVRFGLSGIQPPRGTAFVGLQFVASGSQTSADYVSCCDFVAEQIN